MQPTTTPSSSVRPIQTLLITAAGALVIGLSIVSPSSTRLDIWPWAAFAACAWTIPIAIALLRFALDRPHAHFGGSMDIGLGLLALTAIISALLSPLHGVVLPHTLSVLGTCALPFAFLPALQPSCATAFRRISGALIGVLLSASLLLWLKPWHGLIIPASRNAEPFGHANITGSFAVLAATWLAVGATRETGRIRGLFILGVVGAIATALSSESRGAVLSLATAGATAAGIILLRRGRVWLFIILTLGIAAGAIASNERLREFVTHGHWGSDARESNDQRTAMLIGGLRLGVERPLLGWGPGAVPHVFPRVRADLPGTADNILQLHNSPVQLWATLGALGLLAGAVIVGSMFAGLRVVQWDSERTALASGLIAIAMVIQFDHPFATPAFVLLAAAHLAAWAHLATASPERGNQSNRFDYFSRPASRVCLACLLAVLFVPCLLASVRDLAARQAYSAALDQADANNPSGYVAGLRKALNLAPSDPYYAHQLASYLATGHPLGGELTAPNLTEAAVLLNRTLLANPDLEYAHYNLGWLFVVSDPAKAASHFERAAHLAPQRGAVYFGLGLARLNQNDTAGAIHAFAAEWLLNPAFAWSPLWQQPPFDSLRPQILAQASAAAQQQGQNPWRMLDATTPMPTETTGPAYRRLRTGYGVLMGHPEEPSPVDFNIQTKTILPIELIDSVPAQGWLPGTNLLEFLARPSP